MTLPEQNNLVHLEHGGKVMNAIVDGVEPGVALATGHMLTLCLSVPLQKLDACFLLDEEGGREAATVEDSVSDWGLTTIRLRLSLGKGSIPLPGRGTKKSVVKTRYQKARRKIRIADRAAEAAE